MKKIITITLSLLASLLPLRAQEFQWANKFSGQCEIINMEVDAQDNIYVLGYSTYMGSYQGESLGYRNKGTTFFIKTAPDGSLVWKKLLFGYNEDLLQPNHLMMVGDTALYLFADIMPPKPSSNLYFFDTVLSVNERELIYPADTRFHTWGNLLAIFDTGGTLRTHHLFQQMNVESDGQPCDASYTVQHGLRGPVPACVGNDGYVYITGEFRFDPIVSSYVGMMIDGQTKCKVELQPSLIGAPFVAKLTPEMDSVVWCRPIIQGIETGGSCEPINFVNTGTTKGIAIDNDNNLYVTTNVDYFTNIEQNQLPYWTWHDYEEFVDTAWHAAFILDSNDRTNRIDLDFGLTIASFIQKYDGNGNLLMYKKMKVRPVHQMQNFIVGALSFLYSPIIDNTSGKLYIAADFYNAPYGDTIQYWDYVFNDDDPVHNIRNAGGFLELDRDDLRVTSWGVAQTTLQSNLCRSAHVNPHIAVRNNQIFAQVKYNGQLTSEESEPLVNDNNQSAAMALVRLHRDGPTISAIDYNALGNSSIGGAIAFDSHGDLILTGQADSPLFGEYQLGSGAYIAKLHDPTFNAPYVPEPKEQSILWEQELTLPLAAAALPLTATATSGLPVTYSVDDPAIARLSHDTLLLLAPGTTTLRANQPGDAWWLPAPEVARPVTITSSGNPNAISPVAPEEVLSVEYYDLLGRQLPSAPARGLYLLRTVTTNGTTTRKIIKQ